MCGSDPRSSIGDSGNMASARDIQRRIKGVRSTGKITRAMEMISAVKMRRAVSAVMNVRPYAKSVLVVLRQLAMVERSESHPFLTDRPVKKAIYVVIGSNRGLCGSFNSQVSRRLRTVLEEDRGREAEYVTIGRKADAMVRRLGGDIIASFPDILPAPEVSKIRPIAKLLVERFLSGETDRVVMVYTDFVSVLSQVVKVRALLPIVEKDVLKALHEMYPDTGTDEAVRSDAEYVIEPSSKEVLDGLVLQLLTMELYHGVLESNASKEAARMMAMRNATDAAKDMVSGLTLAYNQIRQAKITAEIAELSAGKAALEN